MTGMIDAHHHLWNYSPDQYSWIGTSMSSLRRDFTAADLEDSIRPLGVTATIVVQARQSVLETEWLLNTAHRESIIAGVVGWLPLASPDIAAEIEQFSNDELFVGVRHVIQDEPDPDFILGDAFNRGVNVATGAGLTYDVLVTERQLPNTVKFLASHPDGNFVIDHMAKPDIANESFDHWAQGIREIARRPNTWCKLSGMVTEAAWDQWSVESLRPYAHTVIEAFGTDRVMFGSDWPVCLVAASYERWFHAASELCAGLSELERHRVFCQNAIHAYQLGGR